MEWEIKDQNASDNMETVDSNFTAASQKCWLVMNGELINASVYMAESLMVIPSARKQINICTDE